MCNNCIHKPVCGKCAATGGHVGKCEHFTQERHGRWVRGISNHREHMKCSVCLKSQTPVGTFTYCPNCGAKMDQ